ncbi:ribonuclease D [Lutibaculum baratangense]|uniref:Ribonuclease D related protein n=1 Tax=Lutibaculum baratangense AMV1 TaxID=631454 RepID=V4R1W4_9HYPH|nr:ribonuclease D [Lutibaculum baratangense]ESR25897.1 Ribonuclease D related protein [Lutibaculum baratangense AMV1]
MTITLHRGDLPADLDLGPVVAVDTETLGLSLVRDKLCLVQLSAGDGTAHLVQVDRGTYDAPNLKRLFADQGVTKIFHYGRFDIAMIARHLGVIAQPCYCTKIASRLTRTYTDRHGLRDLVRDMLEIEISKQQQSSDWGADTLTDAQLSYAASDVLHLHALRARLDALLVREARMDLAEACFRFLPARALLDLAGWDEEDLFAHS